MTFPVTRRSDPWLLFFISVLALIARISPHISDSDISRETPKIMILNRDSWNPNSLAKAECSVTVTPSPKREDVLKSFSYCSKLSQTILR